MLNPVISDEIISLIDDEPKAHLYNINNKDFFKDAPFYNDTLMYYDESHINFYGSEKLALYEGEELSKLLKKLLSDD